MAMKMPGSDAINIAILWLQNNEGIEDSEAEKCKEVAGWLEHQECERYLRHVAKTGGVPMVKVRAMLKRRTTEESK